jgi:hypothetical protein
MRNTTSQRARTRYNPLHLGGFIQTSIRDLKGTLGPVNKAVGYADSNAESHGGIGGGTYNHWFQIKLNSPAWIIIAKGPPRPKYIEVSVYNLSFDPIEGRAIFDQDSIEQVIDGVTYTPYTNHVMSAQSTLYNNLDSTRSDNGNNLYFPLAVGDYLLCVSTTRNEPLDYEVAVVIEFTEDTTAGVPDPIYLLEDYSSYLYESGDPNYIFFDYGPGYMGDDTHQHSLHEWVDAWYREHPSDLPFPKILVPLTTSP